MLVSTHDIPMVAELFNRMIVIDKGEIVGDGDTHQLLGDKSFIENHGLELASPW
jgi:energy-coupling factor transporter ATP-binding protein EcfA2